MNRLIGFLKRIAWKETIIEVNFTYKCTWIKLKCFQKSYPEPSHILRDHYTIAFPFWGKPYFLNHQINNFRDNFGLKIEVGETVKQNAIRKD